MLYYIGALEQNHELYLKYFYRFFCDVVHWRQETAIVIDLTFQLFSLGTFLLAVVLHPKGGK